MKKSLRKFLAVGLIIGTFAGTNAQPQWLTGLAAMIFGAYSVARLPRQIVPLRDTLTPRGTGIPASPMPPWYPTEKEGDWFPLNIIWNHPKKLFLGVAALVGIAQIINVKELHEDEDNIKIGDCIASLRRHRRDIHLPNDYFMPDTVLKSFLLFQKIYKYINPQRHRELIQYGLYCAIQEELPDYVTRFLDAGADPNINAPAYNINYLQYAMVRYGDADNASLNILSALLAHGSVSQANIHQEFRSTLENPRANAATLPIVLLGGMENETLNMAYADGQTPMDLIIRHGRFNMIALLQARGVQPTPAQLDNALLAAINTNNPVWNRFIQAGAQLSIRDAAGNTPLLRAIELDNRAAINDLLPHLTPDDINVHNNANHSALRLSVHAGNCATIVPLLRQRGQFRPAQLNETLLLIPNVEIYQLDKIDAIRELLAAGADINILDQEGNTLLLLATAQNDTSLVQAIVDLGANINVSNTRGETVLHIAVKKGNIQLVEWLLPRLSQDIINAPDRVGHTPLYYAAEGNQNYIFTALRKAGASTEQLLAQ